MKSSLIIFHLPTVCIIKFVLNIVINFKGVYFSEKEISQYSYKYLESSSLVSCYYLLNPLDTAVEVFPLTMIPWGPLQVKYST